MVVSVVFVVVVIGFFNVVKVDDRVLVYSLSDFFLKL